MSSSDLQKLLRTSVKPVHRCYLCTSALQRSWIILLDTMTMISYSCTRGFMPNSHKKSLMVCSVSVLFRLQLEEPITNAVWHGLGSAQCPCSLLPVRKKAPLVDKFYFCGGNQPYGSVGYNGFEVLVDFKYPYILSRVTKDVADHGFQFSG